MRKFKKMFRILAAVTVLVMAISMATASVSACNGVSGPQCSAVKTQSIPSNAALKWQYCWRNNIATWNGSPVSLDSYAALELYYGDPSYDIVYPYARAELFSQSTISQSKFRNFDPRYVAYASNNAQLQVEIQGQLAAYQYGKWTTIDNTIARGQGWANYPTNTYEIVKNAPVNFQALITIRNSSNGVTVAQVAPAVSW